MEHHAKHVAPAHYSARGAGDRYRDGRTALSGSDDSRIVLWDLATSEPMREWSMYGANGVALNGDGTLAVAAFDILSLLCWDTRSAGPPRRLSGHTEAVTCVAVSTDGHTAVSDGVDQRVLLWNTAACELVRGLHGHTGSVRSVALGADGHSAASGSDDRSVIVWDTDTGAIIRRLAARRLVRELSCEERETHHLSPLCDEYGNVPENAPPPVPPESVTSLTLGPASAFPPPPVPTDLPLEPGTSHFDAVQEGRTRTWRFDGRRGQRVTILVTPEGIDLEPNLELHGPGRPVIAVSDDQVTRRAQAGPLELPATGTYQVVVSGRGTSAGGYTITRDAETG